MTDGDGKFWGHFCKEPLPEGSSLTPSQAVALRIFQWCLLYGVEGTLQFIAGDSNTGSRAAFSTLKWSICQLHSNELKLRRLIAKRDGKTSSKERWEGDVEKLLPTVKGLGDS